MDIESLIKWRKTLHQHPELSGEEEATAMRVEEALSDLEPDILLSKIGGHGVFAQFCTAQDRPTVFFRAELDALPVEEENNFEHRSRQPGISHKCGHDGHATILLGLAQRAAAHRQQLGVNLGVIFQPAEEIGKGARSMLEDEQFEGLNPDYCFALHNMPMFPMHSILVKNDYFTPAVKSLIFKLQGKTSHAAEPENGINPAMAVAQALQAAEQLSKNDVEDLALITPIHVVLGEKAYGVSAGHAELHFTLRTLTNKRMNDLVEQLKDKISAIAKAEKLEMELESLEEFYANKNNTQAVDLIRAAARESDLELIELDHPRKWGEDFGAFTQRFRGAIFGLGAGVDTPALHNPDYDFPDELIKTGINIFWKIIQNIR